MSSPQNRANTPVFRLWNSKEQELRFVDVRSFGEMWWVPPGQPMEEVITGLTRLGPEPFSTDFSASYLKQKTQGQQPTDQNSAVGSSPGGWSGQHLRG